MPLQFFEVTGTLKAIRSDSVDAGGDPDVQFISSTVWFHPSVQQVHSVVDTAIYRINSLRARTSVEDGVLRTLDENPVKLPANNSALDLPELFWDVTFEDVVYDIKAFPTPVIDGFRFAAPTTATTIDLATVERLPLPRTRQ